MCQYVTFFSPIIYVLDFRSATAARDCVLRTDIEIAAQRRKLYSLKFSSIFSYMCNKIINDAVVLPFICDRQPQMCELLCKCMSGWLGWRAQYQMNVEKLCRMCGSHFETKDVWHTYTMRTHTTNAARIVFMHVLFHSSSRAYEYPMVNATHRH